MGVPRWAWSSQESSKKNPGRPQVHRSEAAKAKAYRMRVKIKIDGPWKRRPYSDAERSARYRCRVAGKPLPKLHRTLQKFMSKKELKPFIKRRLHK